MRLILFLLTALSAYGQTLTWVSKSVPSGPMNPAWNALDWDHVSQRFLFWGQSATTPGGIIYSTAWWGIDTGTMWTTPASAWTGIYDIGTTNPCDAGLENVTATPAPSHPYRHAAVDTTRDLYWMGPGARSQCGGSGALRWGYRPLQSNTWTWLSAPHTTGLLSYFQSQLVYFPNYDVFVFYGAPDSSVWNMQMYCPTVPYGGGAATGTVSAKQQVVGCADGTADTWISFAAAANLANPSGDHPGKQWGGDCTAPEGCMSYAPPGVYMPTTGKVFALGGTWPFDAPSGTSTAWELGWNGSAWQWTQLTSAPNAYWGYSPIAYDKRRNLVFYHWTDGVSAADYTYYRPADQWTDVGTTGSLNTNYSSLGYDPVSDKLLSISNTSGYFIGALMADLSIFTRGSRGSTFTGKSTFK